MVQHPRPSEIPFLDLGRLHGSIRAELDAAYASVVASGSFVGADAVASFEADLARAHGVAAAAGCGSGTDALALALQAVGVGEGDEVVVPALTFVATLEAVVHAGATPVVADVDPATLLLTPATVDAVRSPRTRAVVPVHLYGHVVPADAIRAWRADGLRVVEDAAQAVLGEADGVGIGQASDAACLSFYPSKVLGALGDGGAVLTDDSAVAAAVASLRDHGVGADGEPEGVGWCSRLDGLQAAFLAVKLPHVASWVEARRRLVERYRQLLGPVVVPCAEGASHHLAVVRVPDRDRLRKDLAQRGIDARVHYPTALSGLPWAHGWVPSPCPAAEQAAAEVLSLPLDPLMPLADVDAVADAVLDVVGESGA